MLRAEEPFLAVSCRDAAAALRRRQPLLGPVLVVPATLPASQAKPGARVIKPAIEPPPRGRGAGRGVGRAEARVSTPRDLLSGPTNTRESRRTIILVMAKSASSDEALAQKDDILTRDLDASKASLKGHVTTLLERSKVRVARGKMDEALQDAECALALCPASLEVRLSATNKVVIVNFDLSSLLHIVSF